MSERRPRRAAVTGIGVVAPNGTSTETFWKSTREGISVLDRVTREGCEHLPLRVAGEVRNFDPPSAVEERYLVQTDRFTHFAMAAADQALDDARLDRPETDAAPFSVGVVTAAGLRRRRVRAAGAAATVVQGQPLRGALPVHRLVLRRDHRPDLHPPRLQGPLRGHRLRRGRMAWTPWRTRRGPCGAAPT